MSSTDPIARTPRPPYWAVIFTSRRTPGDNGYEAMSERMLQLAADQPGYLGIENARTEGGVGITVSYWESLEAIQRWGANAEHRIAQETGRRVWYSDYLLRVARIEDAWEMTSSPNHPRA